MPAKIHRVFGRARRRPAAVIFLVAVLCVALSLALAGPALAIGATWRAAHNLNVAREGHTATLLPNGKVLVAGGISSTTSFYGFLTSCELYDPATDTWTLTGSLGTERSGHTATLLPNGKVLVVGGVNNSGFLNSAELYDPATGTWSPAATFTGARASHTATLLPNGKVLVVGGQDSSTSSTNTALLYDPGSGTWASARPLTTARRTHTASLLPDGTVLVAGGYNYTDGSLNTAQIYTPDSGAGTWSSETTFTNARSDQTATALPGGLVLVAGGVGPSGALNTPLYSYARGEWGNPGPNMLEARWDHTATLLPNGQVLVAGGLNSDSWLNSAEIYSGGTDGTWSATTSLTAARAWHTATLLPNGQVLVTGGRESDGYDLASCELYDYAAGSWTLTSSLPLRRTGSQATLLPNGKVLVVGGSNDDGNPTNELYDYSSGAWTVTGACNTYRSSGHTLTLLPPSIAYPQGGVLVVGGQAVANGNSLASCELYDPGSGTWTTTGSLSYARYAHTATLLANGQVLVSGGWANGTGYITRAELYNPATGTWSTTGSLNTGRYSHTATLLPNGRVLVAGGMYNNNSSCQFAELYDPATGLWTTTGNLNQARVWHTATLLPSGKVLAAGGILRAGGNDTTLASCELYDPATGLWSITGSFNIYREGQTATLLPNGRVLAAGGYQGNTARYLASTELYDPAAGTWTATANLNNASSGHTATLLPNGKVLVAAGFGGAWLSRAELFDAGLGFADTWRPFISTTSSPVTTGGQLYLTSQGSGTGFRGVSGGSGGATNDSPTDYPLVQLRRLDSERQFWVPPSSFSNSSFTSETFQDIQTGYYLVTVFASGIPSAPSNTSFTLLINTGPPTAVQLKSFTAKGSNKYVQLNWQTGAELDTAAFRLWRRDGDQGDYAPNSSLIPAKGSSSRGAKYSYKDTQVVKGQTYYYQLEDIARTGTDGFHGPVSATVGPVKKSLKVKSAPEHGSLQESGVVTEEAPAPAAPATPEKARSWFLR
jgi:N-acetylneuraminic acid mutarotase